MEYWTQITTYPSLLLGPIVVGALVSGVLSAWIARKNRAATSADVDRKIEAERQLTHAQLTHEWDKALTDRAWADYGLRRDIYLDLAKQISCLFDSRAPATLAEIAAAESAKRTFHETGRKVRLIGSDEVVSALNNLTASIKSREPHTVTGSYYSKLMNAIRQDIRTLNEKPPIGTALNESAFPIES
jgi:hypothetical protein